MCSGGALYAAFEMDRYWFETCRDRKGFPKNKKFMKHYEGYSEYYQKGLRYQNEFVYNIALYYLEKNNVENAEKVLLEQDRNKTSYLWNRIKIFKLKQFTNNIEKYQYLKEYLRKKNPHIYIPMNLRLHC